MRLETDSEEACRSSVGLGKNGGAGNGRQSGAMWRGVSRRSVKMGLRWRGVWDGVIGGMLVKGVSCRSRIDVCHLEKLHLEKRQLEESEGGVRWRGVSWRCV